MRQRSAGVLLEVTHWGGKLRDAEGGVDTREVQVRVGPTFSAGETTRAKLCGHCTRALAPPGAPRCPSRCHPATLVFSFFYPCQVLVCSLTFLQKAQLKSRRATRMLWCFQTDGCSLTSGPSQDGRAGTSWERGDRQAELSPRETPISLLPTALELCPAPGVLPSEFI